MAKVASTLLLSTPARPVGEVTMEDGGRVHLKLNISITIFNGHWTELVRDFLTFQNTGCPQKDD